MIRGKFQKKEGKRYVSLKNIFKMTENLFYEANLGPETSQNKLICKNADVFI